MTINYPVTDGQIICNKADKPLGVLLVNLDSTTNTFRPYIWNDVTITTRYISPNEDLYELQGKSAYYDKDGMLCTKRTSKCIGKFLTNAAENGYVQVYISCK